MRDRSRSPQPQLRLTYKALVSELYTRQGEKRNPLDSLFNSPVWLSDTQLIAHERMGDGWLIGPYQVDLKTGRATWLEAMGDRINGSRGASWKVSPDRQWVLWPQGSPDPEHLCATRIDGKDHCEFRGDSAWGYFFGWLPGNRPVFLNSPTSSRVAHRFPRSVEAHIYRLGHEKAVRRIRVPSLREDQWVGVTPDGAVVLMGLEDSRTASLARIDLSETSAHLARWRVSLPQAVSKHGLTAALSPDGRRLAWRLEGSKRASIAVSDLQGKHFQQWPRKSCTNVQWLPSGKAISFVDRPDSYDVPDDAHLYTLAMR